MLNPYFSNPIALYAKGFEDFETESFYDLCEQINYKIGEHTAEQSHLATMLLELEKHIYNLKNISEMEKVSSQYIEKFVRYIEAERGSLAVLINSFNDFSPEVNLFRFEFAKLLNGKNKNIPLTQCRISALIKNLKNKIKEEDFVKEKNKLRTRIEKNRQSLFKYTNFLQQRCSNLEIVRFEIAFYCRNENEINKFMKKYIKYKKDFLYFLTKRQFKHSLIGHMWRFQPQQEDGYISCHVILFINKDDLEEDFKPHDLNNKMKVLRSRWEELRGNNDGFWVCNSDLRYRCTCAVSSKKSDNGIETELKKIVNYFINPDYFIRLNLAKGIRSYGRGEIPDTQ